jgi:hypothetical protein
MQGDAMFCGRVGDLVIADDPFVADSQMRLFFSGDRLAVEDIAGCNGVSTRLRGDHEVAAGGELRIGRQRLVVDPIPPLSAAEDGATAWGSPDAGYRFRLLQLFEGGVRGGAFLLKDGDNLVGREFGDISFPTDGFVSGRHAMIHVAPERIIVRDLGSSNGTFLRLTAPTFVDNGDQFLIGRQLVRIELTA